MAMTGLMAPGGTLDRYFHVSERGSTVRTEIVAGLATWLTMAYILFVNPSILGSVPDKNGTSLGFAAVLTVTALAAGVMTLAMGIWANYPFALAAGLGLNAFVTFTLVATLKLTWPEAMGVIVVEGVVISVLVVTGFREAVLNAIPMDLKRSIGIGIGMFLAIIGLHNGGIVIAGSADPTAPPVSIAPHLANLHVLTFLIGLALTSALVARRIKGGLLIGILGTTVFAVVLNEIWGDGAIWANGVAQVPSKLVSSPDFGLVGKFNLGVFGSIGTATALAAILAVMLSDFFDTMGTVVALGEEAGLLKRGRHASGHQPGAARRLARRGGGRADVVVVEHDVHRERRRDR